MGRFTTLIGALVLVVSACSGGASSASTPVPTTPASTSAPSTPAPTPAPSTSQVALSATVTFNGQTCTYSGPAVIPRGAALTFTLVNTPALAKDGAALFVTPVLDGTTWEQVLAWTDTRHVFPLPDWMRIPGTGYDAYKANEIDLGEALSLLPKSDRSDVTITGVMTRNLYVVTCNTSPAEGQVPYPAILLNVLDGS